MHALTIEVPAYVYGLVVLVSLTFFGLFCPRRVLGQFVLKECKKNEEKKIWTFLGVLQLILLNKVDLDDF